MEAFHNDPEIQAKYLKRIRDHAEADEFEKGYYWENGKGCAVGCTIHGNNHQNYETELGIPEWLAHLEDGVFENLPNEQAKLWPVEFLEAINLGADLNKIKPAFMIYILEQALLNFNHEQYPDVKNSIDTVIDLWKKDPTQIDTEAWSAAQLAALSVAESARSAWSAAWSAWSAWSAACSVAESVAESATYIKYSEKLLEMIRECKQ